MLKASRNSFVMTENATGVSFSAVEIRPPASELAATKPTSASAFTLKGSRRTASSAVVAVTGLAGAVWPKAEQRPNPSRIEPVRTMNRKSGIFMDEKVHVHFARAEGTLDSLRGNCRV